MNNLSIYSIYLYLSFGQNNNNNNNNNSHNIQKKTNCQYNIYDIFTCTETMMMLFHIPPIIQIKIYNLNY